MYRDGDTKFDSKRCEKTKNLRHREPLRTNPGKSDGKHQTKTPKKNRDGKHQAKTTQKNP